MKKFFLIYVIPVVLTLASFTPKKVIIGAVALIVTENAKAQRNLTLADTVLFKMAAYVPTLSTVGPTSLTIDGSADFALQLPPVDYNRDIQNAPVFASVAFSNDYRDLNFCPVIPIYGTGIWNNSNQWNVDTAGIIMSKDRAYAAISNITISVAGKANSATTLSGYGITDAYPLSGNPSSFITQTGARNAISLSTTGSSGAATYNSTTGVFNIPQYSGVTSIGLTSTDFAVSGSPVTSSGNITINLNTTGVSAGTYAWVTVNTKGQVTAGGNMSVPTSIAAGARNFNTAYQISTTAYSRISLGASISCNLSLSGGQAGTVLLEISPNGSTGWISIAPISNSNLGTLTIGLNTTQTGGYQLITDLPPGYYYRMTTTNNTGTPTFSFTGGSYITY